MTDKFEQLLEFVVNDEQDKAQALFHEIVVEKSRQIYEGLISAEAEEVGDRDVDSLIDAISDDEESIAEEGEEDNAEEIPADDAGEEMPMDGEEHGDEEAGEEGDVEDLEARIDDITDALAQLKAQFADMLSAEAGEEMPAGDEMPADMDAEMGELDGEPKEESVLEYKEAAPKPVLTATSDSNKSPVAAKNDMGGSAKNIAQGSSDEKGRSAPKAGSFTSANTEFKMSKVAAPKNKE